MAPRPLLVILWGSRLMPYTAVSAPLARALSTLQGSMALCSDSVVTKRVRMLGAAIHACIPGQPALVACMQLHGTGRLRCTWRMLRRFPGSPVLGVLRAQAVLLQGIWFIQIAQILFRGALPAPMCRPMLISSPALRVQSLPSHCCQGSTWCHMLTGILA